jgi:cytochrome c553
MAAESDDPRAAFRAVAAVATVLAIAIVFGLGIVPLIQGHEAGIDPWTAFCRAVGVAPGSPAMPQPAAPGEAHPASLVAWTPQVLDRLAGADRQAGAQLAKQVCAGCHGANGVSPTPAFPDLAGQSAAAIYKQLHDFKSGARSQPVMSGIAQTLTEPQMLDVAVYFAGSNAFGALGHGHPAADPVARQLVENGDPGRRIAACNACHGAGAGGPIETPTLDGQHQSYLASQLQQFAGGQRHNDIFGRMRNIAAQLTPDEIARLTRYYQGGSGPGSGAGSGAGLGVGSGGG